MKIVTPTKDRPYYRLVTTQKELGKGKEGLGRGLEISIKGLTRDSEGSNSVFIEYYKDKVWLHVWTHGSQDPKSIELT